MLGCPVERRKQKKVTYYMIALLLIIVFIRILFGITSPYQLHELEN